MSRNMMVWRIAVTVFICTMCVTPSYAQPTQAETSSNTNNRFEISPRGYVQFDWRGYPDWTVATGSGRLEYETFAVRRLRAGIDGQWRRMAFEFTVDPMDDLDDTLIKDAYIQFRLTRALRLRGGQFKLPGSREYGTSARSLDFLERSAFAQSIAPGRDIGGMAFGELGRRFAYEAGLFAGDGNGRNSRAGITTAGRVVWNGPRGVELAASLAEGRTTAVDTEPANGLEGRSQSGYRFFERLYVDGWRTRVGGEAQWTPGRWQVRAEAMRVRDERAGQGLDLEDLPGAVGIGWSAALTREFGRRPGATRSRLREWTLGIRFDSLEFDDEGPETLEESVRPRATDVRARGGQTLATSISWNLSRWARVMGNASLERYTEARSAPDPGNQGVYWAFGTRLQIQMP
jgi:phosphate-selective porin